MKYVNEAVAVLVEFLMFWAAVAVAALGFGKLGVHYNTEAVAVVIYMGRMLLVNTVKPIATHWHTARVVADLHRDAAVAQAQAAQAAKNTTAPRTGGTGAYL